MNLNFYNAKFKNHIYLFFICVIFIIGFALRFKFFITNYPLWHDECSLAMSIINKDIWKYFGLLDYNQSAPPIFMMLTKFFANIFGIKEFVLRIVPFICGITSIPIFYYFSKLFIDKKFVIILLNFLFAINYQLIHYSFEFKQYSSDVLLFMLCCIFCSKVDLKDISLNKLIILVFIFTILPMISIPTVFIILGFFIHQIILYKKEILKNILVIMGITFFFWGLYALNTIIPQQSQKFLMDGLYWEKGFLAFNLKKILVLLKINLIYYLYPNKLILFDIILIFTGLYYLFKNRKNKSAAILSLSLLLIITASFLKQYPIYERVSLYLIPVVLVLILLPLSKITYSKKIGSFIIISLTMFGIMGYNIQYLKVFFDGNLYSRNDARGAMLELKEKYKDYSEYIIVNSASRSEFNYYKNYYNFNPEKVIIVQSPSYSKTEYYKALDMLPNNNDYWFYYAYEYSHSPVIPFLTEYSKDYTVLYESTIGGSYLLNLHK